MPDEPIPADEPATPATKKPAPPETFPMGLPEYAATTGCDPLWIAGLAAYAGTQERQRAEWDALLAEFQARPVQNS